MNINYKLLTKNAWSRPERVSDMKQIKRIVLHWISVPKQPASIVWNYFEGRKAGKTGYGSAHFIVDISGDIIQALPQNEMAYHVGSKTYTDYAISFSSYPNNSTLGIELCHTSIEGEMTDETWDNAKQLTYLLLREFNLNETDITTHRKIVGWKQCPMWFFIFPEELDRFKEEVKNIFDYKLIGYVTPGVVNVRSDIMGTIVGTVQRNNKVELIGYKNGWYKLRKDKLEGYINSKYIEVL